MFEPHQVNHELLPKSLPAKHLELLERTPLSGAVFFLACHHQEACSRSGNDGSLRWLPHGPQTTVLSPNTSEINRRDEHHVDQRHKFSSAGKKTSRPDIPCPTLKQSWLHCPETILFGFQNHPSWRRVVVNVIVDKEREREIQADRQAGRQTDRQTDKPNQTKPTNKQTNRLFGLVSALSSARPTAFLCL